MADVPQFPRDRVREQIDQIIAEERKRAEEQHLADEKRKKAYLDGAAIAIALFAAAFTGWQAWEAHETRKEAAQLTLESLHSSQRAYVSVDAGFNDESVPVIQIRTFGNSPAVEVDLDDVQCDYQDTAETGGGGGAGFTLGNLGRVLAPGTLIAKPCIALAMGKRDKYAHVYGEVTYKDIFGKPHRTNFCYIAPTGRNKPMDACLEGNHAD